MGAREAAAGSALSYPIAEGTTVSFRQAGDAKYPAAFMQSRLGELHFEKYARGWLMCSAPYVMTDEEYLTLKQRLESAYSCYLNDLIVG